MDMNIKFDNDDGQLFNNLGRYTHIVGKLSILLWHKVISHLLLE